MIIDQSLDALPQRTIAARRLDEVTPGVGVDDVDCITQDFFDRQGFRLHGVTGQFCVSAFQCVKTAGRGSRKTETEWRVTRR